MPGLTFFKVPAIYALSSFLYAKARSWFFADLRVLHRNFVTLWRFCCFFRLLFSRTILDLFSVRDLFSQSTFLLKSVRSASIS
jgi:hypothetical protein